MSPRPDPERADDPALLRVLEGAAALCGAGCAAIVVAGEDGLRTVAVVGTEPRSAVLDLCARVVGQGRAVAELASVAVPVVDPAGTLLGALCVADAGERAWAPAQVDGLQALADAAAYRVVALREQLDRRLSALRAQAVFDGAMDAILLMDGDGRLVGANPAARELFGWAADQAVGQLLGTLIVPGDERERHRAGLAAHLRDGRTRMTGRRVRTEAVLADGSLVPVEVTVTSCGTPAHPLFAGHVRDLRGETALREERDRATSLFRTMVEGLPAAIYLVSTDRTRTDYLSPQLERWTGVPVHEWIADPAAFVQVLHPDDREVVSARVQEADRSGEPLVSEHRFVARDGEVLWVSVQERNVLGPDGLATARLGVIVDVTAQRETAQRLETAHRQVSAMLAAAPMALFVLDPDGRFTHVDGSALAALGRVPADFVGRSVGSLCPGGDGLPVWVTRALDGERLTTLAPWAERVFEISVDSTRGPDGAVASVIGVAIDVTDRTLTEAALTHQSTHDTVTGLLNRAGLLVEVDTALTRARRHGTSVAVAVLDLDRFRVVNDSFGHAAGDDVLRSVSATLTRTLEHLRLSGDPAAAGAVLGRQGADEFVVVLHGAGTDRCAAVALVDALLTALASSPALVGADGREVEFAVTATAGLSVFPVDAASTEELFAHADTAIHETKRSDRGGVGHYDATLDINRARLSMTARLRRAIEGGSLDAAFQPVVDLQDGRPGSVEALARWTDDELGVVSPLEFIELAEDAGLIVPLGRLMLERTCAQLATWRREGLSVSAAVNVSVAQLRSPTILEDLDQALAAHGVAPSALTIELTESAAMQGADGVLTAVRDRGVRVAIDDFGTGHSSLARLRDLDVDLVKLDGSFISALPALRAATLITAFVAIADALDLGTVAEGIETAAQRDWLRAAGVRLGQGYLFARPMSGAQVSAWWVQRLTAPAS